MIFFLLLCLLLVATILLLILETKYIHVILKDFDTNALNIHENDDDDESTDDDSKTRNDSETEEPKILDFVNNKDKDPFLTVSDKNLHAKRKELKQNLNSLIYLFKMESNFYSEERHQDLKEVFEIRSELRVKTLRLTQELKKINSLNTEDNNEFNPI